MKFFKYNVLFLFITIVIPMIASAATLRDNKFCFSWVFNNEPNYIKVLGIEDEEDIGHAITQNQPYKGLSWSQLNAKTDDDCINIQAGRKSSTQALDDTKKLLEPNVKWSRFNMTSNGYWVYEAYMPKDVTDAYDKPKSLNFAVKLNLKITYKEYGRDIKETTCENIIVAQETTGTWWVISNINGDQDPSYNEEYLSIKCDSGTLQFRRYVAGMNRPIKT